MGQDHYYVWPNELKVLPRTCASIYPYEEDDHVKENIKKSCVADGYEKEREFDFSDQGNAVFYKKAEASEVHILSVIETANILYICDFLQKNRFIACKTDSGRSKWIAHVQEPVPSGGDIQ